jgi:hypothetical protein
MQKRMVLSILALVCVGGLVVLLHSSLKEPSGAATGRADGCGGDPVGGVGEVETDVILAEAERDEEAPVQLTYRLEATPSSCPKLVVEPVDRVVSFEDSCGAPGMIRTWDLSDDEAARLLEAYLLIQGLECRSVDCLTVLTKSNKKLELDLESPMREHILSLLDQAKGIQAISTGMDDDEAEDPAVAAEEPGPQGAAVDEGTDLQVTLRPEQGADFGRGSLVVQGHPLKVDLICYAGKKGLDCQAGAGPTVANQKHLKLFRTPGGVTRTFSSLAEVPTEIPAVGNRDMLKGAAAGMGFVLENNLTETYTRGFVKAADPGSVTIQYSVFAAD